MEKYLLISAVLLLSSLPLAAEDSTEVVRTILSAPAMARYPGHRIDQDVACKEMQPGDSLNLDVPWNRTPSNQVSRKYTLQRSASNPKEFKVDIPIDFSVMPGLLDRLYGSIQAPEQMREGRDGDLIARFMNRANKVLLSTKQT